MTVACRGIGQSNAIADWGSSLGNAMIHRHNLLRRHDGLQAKTLHRPPWPNEAAGVWRCGKTGLEMRPPPSPDEEPV